MDSFEDFHFITPIARAIQEANYSIPTPIQVQAIPHILAHHDVIGIAQTGTGKTAAFVFPILQHLIQHKKVTPRGTPRVLILAPTRELAAQIDESFRVYGKHAPIVSLALFGGVSQGPQVHALSKNIDVIIATPGRLLDLMRQRFVHIDAVEVFVLDEADRMLDMGFSDDIKLLAKELPHERQTLLFSATLSENIAALAHSYLRKPVSVTVTTEATTVAKTEQTVFFVDKEDKVALLRRILKGEHVKRAIVFVPMKHVADKIVAKLAAEGIAADALHSDKTQAMRTQTMNNFRAGKTRVLVATDIAARGIDVDDITHIINFDIPKDATTYVHRIGRTARAGAEGTAISFCSGEDKYNLLAIERLINKKLTVKEHKFHSVFAQNGGVMSTAKVVPVQARTGRGGGRFKGRSKIKPSKIKSNHVARHSKSWIQK